MSKIQDKVKFLLNKHKNADAAADALEKWTAERRIFLLSKLDWMESSLDKDNHEAYRIAYNQLKSAIKNQEATLNKIHDLLLFDDNKK